ncbi:alkaline-phosphatase-like protein [Phascolomyces articulosus]|uniref:GPI ethanolamine phosphate transferase 2 n=1 Tax=Phascolomyces articulosus TaxID=60185 RepID=A0AAD5KK65_9FUNG|nr:alkaline-phosphatase-like protein [Phascolomyces articulosus]
MLCQVQQPLNLICLLAIIQIIGLSLFARGFFPYKVYLSGFANVTSVPSWPDVTTETITRPTLIEPEFDQLVFIVVDALRNDFVLGPDSGFGFVKSQIELGHALPYTARATAPTVTMPRIKALTTGTVPSFLDAILNIAESDTSSSLQHHDNWVQQFRQTGNRTIHFFGDDTWIRLFPNTFTKFDGTTSFYVSDTVQVDLNVTRHIQPVFAEQDWDAIILHYLGLDHVGHLGGPYSPLMKPKQKEMDQAVEKIYEIVAQQDAERIKRDADAKGTLIILCGDHGMNEAGNHGGSSIGETSAALVFLSPRFESRPIINNNINSKFNFEFSEDDTRIFGFPVIDQIDVVPTLASLFSFPIPKNSLGKVIPELLQRNNHGPPIQLLRALQLNAHQLGQLLCRMLPDLVYYLDNPTQALSDTSISNPMGQLYSRAIMDHGKFLSSSDPIIAEKAAKAYLEFIYEAQSQLARTASDYKLTDMAIGTCLMTISAVIFIYRVFFFSDKLSSLWWSTKIVMLGMLIAYFISLFASSFIEEEHFIWYYFISTLFLLLALQSFKIPNKNLMQQTWLSILCILQLILMRITIAWDGGIKLMITEEIKWHLLAISLLTPLLWLICMMWRSSGRINIQATSGGAGYIITICKVMLILIMTLTSSLIFLYKIRSEQPSQQDEETIPGLYRYFMSQLEFANHLDQVALGKLIYNYCGSGLFVLTALVYVMKRASVLDMEGHEHQQQEATKTQHYLDTLLCMITPTLILFTRSHYAPLFIIYTVQLYLLRKWHGALPLSSLSPSGSGYHAGSGESTRIIAFLILCMIHAAFFMTGHSNSIAAIDLSNAYIGVTGYDTILIGALTFCSNWSTSIWWCIAGWILVADGQGSWWEYATTHSAMFSAILVVLSVAVTILREHLFIWTVFSPKYLYQMAWTCLFHWCIQIMFGTLSMRFYRVLRKQYSVVVSDE